MTIGYTRHLNPTHAQKCQYQNDQIIETDPLESESHQSCETLTNFSPTSEKIQIFIMYARTKK